MSVFRELPDCRESGSDQLAVMCKIISAGERDRIMEDVGSVGRVGSNQRHFFIQIDV